MNPNFTKFHSIVTSPLKYRVFLLTKLPSAWFAGLKLEKLTGEQAIVSVRQRWFNTNPFKSIYVAILSMPSEVSTGVLCMASIYGRTPAVSMLVVQSEAVFHKKATGKIWFTCNDGAKINDAVEEAISTRQSTVVKCYTVGTNEPGVVVAEFYFTWSFKVKQ